MGLFSTYFTGATTYKRGDASFEAAQEQIANAKKGLESKVKDLGSSSDSLLKVPGQSKDEKRNASGGSATYFTTEVIPTDFVPNPEKKSSAQTPDYYRFGRHEHKEVVTVDGEKTTIRQWAPVPQLVADRIKPTYANIRLIQAGKASQDDPKSPGLRLIPEYSKFFLTGVQEAHQEKFQTVETFNDWYVFFYGERPPVYTFSGVLLNLLNYNWFNEFLYLYQNFWRGTKAIEWKSKVYLTYNYQQVQGYIVGVNANIDAFTDKGIPFSITMLITDRKIFSGTRDDGVIRDSFIPQTDTGFADTNSKATQISKILALDVLQRTKPAKDNGIVNDKNIDQANKAINEKSQSAEVQSETRVGQEQIKTGASQSQSWASSLKAGVSSAYTSARGFLGF